MKGVGRRLARASLLLGALVPGCGDGRPLLFPGAAEFVPGEATRPQGRVGEELLPPPEVLLQDHRGNPAPGVEVTFEPLAGSGRIEPSRVTTDERGVARARGWLLGEEAGTQALEVRAPGLPVLTLEAVALPGPPARMEGVEAQEERTGQVGEAVASPPAARLTDAFGNPIPGRAVSFELVDEGSLVPASAVTDDEGIARVERWTLGPRAGDQSLLARFGELEPATFRVRAIPGPPAEMEAEEGTAPEGVVGEPLDAPPAVRVVDRFGNGVPAVPVHFQVAPVHGTVTPSQVPSDSMGRAAPSEWILGPQAGTQILEAGVESLAVLRLEALARAGVAALVEPLSPLEQEAVVDSIVPHLPTVRVTDAHGNPSEGAEVTFRVLVGGGRVEGSPASSGPDGRAAPLAWHLGPEPGENRVEARVEGVDTVVQFLALGREIPPFDLLVEGVQLNQGSQRLNGGILPVAGRGAILRVTVRSTLPSDAQPPVRVRLRAGGGPEREEWVVRGEPGVEVEPDLTLGTSTWNLLLSPHEVVPGLAVQVEVDPDGTVEVDRRETNRYPRDGGFASLGVVADSDLRVRFIPVHQSSTGLTGQVDPGNGADFLDATWRLFPLGGIEWEVREPFTTDAPPLDPSNANGSWTQILSEVQALRVAEGATDQYYYGVVRWPFTGEGIAGIGYILPSPSHPARTALGYDNPQGRSVIMAHELGHNLGRRHSPCGFAPGVDPLYPYPGGLIGAAGWDVATQRFISPAGGARDIMGYCSPVWISDYTFGAIRGWRRDDPLAPAGPAAAFSMARDALLVWGRIDSRGPVLEPAFRMEGRLLEPEGRGPHRVTLLDGEGAVLYGRGFPGTPVEHAPDPEERHFAFLLPLDRETAARVAVLRVETPFGSAERSLPPAGAPGPEDAAPTLVQVADRAELTWDPSRFPMALVRDGVTGRVLAMGRSGAVGVPLPAGRSLSDLRIHLSDGVRSVEVAPP